MPGPGQSGPHRSGRRILDGSCGARAATREPDRALRCSPRRSDASDPCSTGTAWTPARSPARPEADAPAARRCCASLCAAPAAARPVCRHWPGAVSRRSVPDQTRSVRRRRSPRAPIVRRRSGSSTWRSLRADHRSRLRKPAPSRQEPQGQRGDLRGEAPYRRATRTHSQSPAKQDASGNLRRPLRHLRDHTRPLRKTFNQHRQLRPRHRHRTLANRWPGKAPILQPLRR
ncbi:hypothetical protein ACVMBZ_010002 [Bradyrhizobium liaoningense]